MKISGGRRVNTSSMAIRWGPVARESRNLAFGIVDGRPTVQFKGVYVDCFGVMRLRSWRQRPHSVSGDNQQTNTGRLATHIQGERVFT